MNFSQFSLLKFGNYVKRHEKYLGMRKKLRAAHLFKPYEEYVSEVIAISLITAIVGLILGIVVLFGALMLRNNTASKKVWGIIIVVFSIPSVIMGGGFIIGFILGIIGGKIALSTKPKTQATKPATT